MPRVLLAAAGVLMLGGCAAGGPADPIPRPTHLDPTSVDVAKSDRNGIEYLSGDDALRVSLRHLRSAAGVEMSMSFTQHPDAEGGAAGGKMTVDYAGRSGAFTAAISDGDSRIDVVVVEGDAYLRADAATAAAWGLSSAGFSCRARTDPILDEWGALLDPALLIESLTRGSVLSTGPVASGDPETVNVIVDSGEGSAGTVVVSAVAQPRVLRMTVGDAASVADIVFSKWGDEVPVEVPAQIADACR
jgi:hypothetical protein